MSKLNRKSVITGVIVIVTLALLSFTIISNLNYNKNLPKVTTVQATLDMYNITKQYEGTFSYTALKGYTFPHDIRIDEILIREGDVVAKGDKLLKISFIDQNLIATITTQMESNKSEIALLSRQYQLDKSGYSPNLYVAQLESEIAELEQKSKELWYDKSGGIDREIEIIEKEIAILFEENDALINKEATEDDVAKLEMEIQIYNLLESIHNAQTSEEAEKYRQQYDVKQIEYDILLKQYSEDRRSLAIKKNTSAIIDKIEQIDILDLKKASVSTIPEQIAAKQNELANFQKSGVNDTTLKLDTQLKAINSLKQQNETLAQSIEPLVAIKEAGGFVIAQEDFTVHKITAGIDVVHKANENIFTHTTSDSKPCFKWSTEKDKFQGNFDIDSEVNVKYLSGSSYFHEPIKIASKMQLDSTTEYLSTVGEIKMPVDEVEITMSHQRDDYVTYLPKAALHKNAYGEQVVYAVYQQDGIFSRESFVKELPAQVLAEDEREYIVTISTDGKEYNGYVANISMPIMDGDIVKVVKAFSEQNPFSSKGSQ